jgi:hypothetical protein
VVAGEETDGEEKEHEPFAMPTVHLQQTDTMPASSWMQVCHTKTLSFTTSSTYSVDFQLFSCRVHGKISITMPHHLGCLFSMKHGCARSELRLARRVYRLNSLFRVCELILSKLSLVEFDLFPYGSILN